MLNGLAAGDWGEIGILGRSLRALRLKMKMFQDSRAQPDYGLISAAKIAFHWSSKSKFQLLWLNLNVAIVFRFAGGQILALVVIHVIRVAVAPTSNTERWAIAR